jgi:hypothetical protein
VPSSARYELVDMMASGTSKMREHVARAHAAARQAQDGVEAPARLVHLDRELFDQVVVFVVAHVQVLAVFGQHAGNSSIDSWLRRCNAGQRPIWLLNRPGRGGAS